MDESPREKFSREFVEAIAKIDPKYEPTILDWGVIKEMFKAGDEPADAARKYVRDRE